MNSTLNTDISHARSFICLGTGNSMKNKWAYILVCIIMCMCLCIIRCSIVESSHVPFVGNFNRCTYGQLSWSIPNKSILGQFVNVSQVQLYVSPET